MQSDDVDHRQTSRELLNFEIFHADIIVPLEPQSVDRVWIYWIMVCVVDHRYRAMWGKDDLG